MKFKPQTKGVTRNAVLHLWGGRFVSLFFILLALAVFLVSSGRPGVFSGARTAAMDMTAPLLSAVNAPIKATSEYVGALTGLTQLQAQNQTLMAENARLKEWYERAMILESENQSLQKLLNVKLEPHHRFVTAGVIADSGNAYMHSMIVKAGTLDGVLDGQAVLSGEGVIGRIIETGRKASRVLMLTDMNARIPVLIKETGERAVMAGNNSPSPSLIYLQQESKIPPGAHVITSGHGGLFPFGLPVGRVVQDKDGKAAVKPYADMGRISFVRIVDSDRDPNLIEGAVRPGE